MRVTITTEPNRTAIEVEVIERVMGVATDAETDILTVTYATPEGDVKSRAWHAHEFVSAVIDPHEGDRS